MMEFRDAKTMIKAGGNPYNDGTRTRKITFWVIIGHIVCILVPLISFWIAGMCASCSPIQKKPQELVVQVGLVNDQPLGNTQEPAPAIAEPSAELPVPLPPPIEQPKPVEIKPKPVKRPYLSADQITVNRSSDAQLQKQRQEADRRRRQQESERQRQAQQDYQRRLAEYNAAQQRAAAQRQQALEGIRRNVASVQGVVNAGLQGVQATQYINDLKRVIDPLFIQPSDTLLKGAKPSVNVKLTISPAGRLVSAAIISRSGNGAMDESVEIWIGKVRNTQLPRPSQVQGNVTVTVTLLCR